MRKILFNVLPIILILGASMAIADELHFMTLKGEGVFAYAAPSGTDYSLWDTAVTIDVAGVYKCNRVQVGSYIDLLLDSFATMHIYWSCDSLTWIETTTEIDSSTTDLYGVSQVYPIDSFFRYIQLRPEINDEAATTGDTGQSVYRWVVNMWYQN